MKEFWKPIIGYEGYYEVSNLGRVKQLSVTTNLNGKKYTRSEKIKTQTLRNGYYVVGLTKEGKRQTFLVHRLVALTFIPNNDSNKFDCVNHKDENKLNNRVDNLEWCDRAYNANYGTRNRRLSELTTEWNIAHRKELSERVKKSWKDGKNKGFTGKKHSDLTKQKISNTIKEGYNSGRIVNPMKGVHRYGQDAPRYGAKLSEETKLKISNAIKGFKHTDETKKKMSENVKNRIFMNNGSINKRIKKEDVNKYLDMGFVKGRLTPWQSNT